MFAVMCMLYLRFVEAMTILLIWKATEKTNRFILLNLLDGCVNCVYSTHVCLCVCVCLSRTCDLCSEVTAIDITVTNEE